MRGNESTTAAGSGRRSIRDEQRELTRQRLIASAQAVFERSGYGAATIGDITTEANVNRATFYLHFANKAEIWVAITDLLYQDTARYWAMLDDALLVGTRAAMRAWLDKAVDYWEDNAPVLPAAHEAMAMDLEIAARWKRNLDALAVELRNYLGRMPEERREIEMLRVQLLVVQLDQVCFRWRVQKVFDADREQLLALLTDIWCSVLGIE